MNSAPRRVFDFKGVSGYIALIQMAYMHYNKPPISISDQIQLLKARGLIIPDEKRAAHYLSNISYYRLRAYTYPFQDNSLPDHPFVKSIDFDQIIDIYVFDRRLRLLVMDAIEKIEIAFRTKIIYNYALKYGAFWHENSSLFHNQSRHKNDLARLYEEIDRSMETFIAHYRSKYKVPAYPPAWMSIEVVSIGLLSKLFGNLKRDKTKRSVAHEFGLNSIEMLENWLHVFVGIRNICAHHGRLWNRRLTLQPELPLRPLNTFVPIQGIYRNKLYAALCCITYVLHIISPGNSFNARLKQLIGEFYMIDVKEMGFVDGWDEAILWH